MTEMSHTFDAETRKRCLEILDRFPNCNFLVVGDLMLDIYLEGKAAGVADEAPVPLLEIRQSHAQPGGAANVAANLSALGARTVLLGGAGDDEAGVTLKQLLQSRHIMLHPLGWERETTQKTRILSGTHYYLRLDQEDSSPLPDTTNLRLIQALEELIPAVDAVVVSDYAKGIINPATAAALEETAARCQKPVYADIKPANISLWKKMDLLTPNRQEAFSMLERPGGHPTEPLHSETLARELKKRIGGSLLLKLSEEGMLAVDQQGVLTAFPAFCKNPANTTGAGDTVLAVASAALGCRATLAEAGWLASLAASIAVSRADTYPVTSEELRKALS
jgi:rfaE bifunctional protein kinase chain/domain